MIYLWVTRGRDEKTGRKTVIPHYHPPEGLTPTEAGILIDEKMHHRDITATIIDYAVRGFLTITETKKKDHELELIKTPKNPPTHEMYVLEGLFGKTLAPGTKVKLKALRRTFPQQVRHIQKTATKALIKKGFLPHDPHNVRNGYLGCGGGLLFVASYLGGVASIYTVGSVIATGLILMLFSQVMPRRTALGAEKYYELRGLYEYIKTAEKDRLDFQEKANIFFEKLLPYAVAFNQTKHWAKAFKDLIKEPPEWYHSANRRDLTDLMVFSSALDRFNTQAARHAFVNMKKGGVGSAFTGGSGFGGGGFSGGGFGGGGSRGL